jgi:hypothetical protein
MGISYLNAAAGWDWSKLRGKERDLALQASEGVLTKKEANFREFAADFLGCYWATQMGTEIPSNYWPHIKYTDDRAPEVFRALLWVVQEGLIHMGPNGILGKT